MITRSSVPKTKPRLRTGDARIRASRGFASSAALGQGFLESCPDRVDILDAKGSLKLINSAGLELAEIEDHSALRGLRWVDLWPLPMRGAVEQALADARDGATGHFSGFSPTARGTPRWWDVVVSPLRDRRQRLVGLLAISRDITRQKAVEVSLRVSEQRFRALADNMAQFAWMADATGYIFWYNQRWFDYTGTTLDDMAGWGWTKVHHPDHVDRVVKKFEAHISSGEVWEDTFPLRGSDGGYRWFLSRARPIHDDNGEVVLWCGTNTDVTEQRTAGQRLRQMARLIELSHEAILAWDIEDGIIMWNKGCEELYGFARAEVLGARSHDVLGTRHPMTTEAFERMLVEQGSWTGELRHVAKNGAEVWVDSRHELLQIGDRRVILETNRDITERRRADALRNLLMAELNHRVKNTLAIVQAIASQTARSAAGKAEFVASFTGRIESLAAAHNVLTDASWSGASLRELLASEIAVTAGENDRISLEGEDVFLSSQVALQLTLIIHELATNALRHGSLSRPQGRVSIDWRVSDDANGDRKLHLTWRETGGPAVAPPASRGFGTMLIERSGRLPHLDASLTFEAAGVVCRVQADIAEAPHGEAAYFNPGRGRQTATDRVDGARSRLAGGGERRVLIIEDEPLLATEVEAALSGAGFVSLGPAASVDAAMAAIADLLFDAAVVDRTLLGKTADPIMVELDRRRIPYVLLTGMGPPEQVAPSPTVPVIMKPFDAASLVTALRTVLAR